MLYYVHICGCSSSGRAPPSQGGCGGFESRHPLHKETSFVCHGKRRFLFFWAKHMQKAAKSPVYFFRFFTLQKRPKSGICRRLEPLPKQDSIILIRQQKALPFNGEGKIRRIDRCGLTQYRAPKIMARMLWKKPMIFWKKLLLWSLPHHLQEPCWGWLLLPPLSPEEASFSNFAVRVTSLVTV